MRAAYAEEEGGCLHLPLNARESGTVTQQRRQARKGVDFFTAKPLQPPLCVAL